MDSKTSTITARFLLVPSLLRVRGFGHLKRCLNLLKELGTGRIFWPDAPLGREEEFFSRDQWASQLPEGSIIKDLGNHSFEIILVDQQISDKATTLKLLNHASVLLSWDEGGKARLWSEYLIDSLPNTQVTPPNLINRSFLGLGDQVPFINRPIRRVLISFGGADPSNLTPRILRFLKYRFQFQDSWEIGVVEGPYFKQKIMDAPGIKVIRAPGSLGPFFKDFDLFLGSFGLGALEAVRHGLPVVLLNPTTYHQKIARTWGFNEIGVKHPQLKLWHRSLMNLKDSWEKVTSNLNSGSGTMAGFLESFKASQPGCPVCRSRDGKVLNRQEGRSFFRCKKCSMVYMRTFNQKPMEYSEAYFFEDYQKQYGKTYLEDFAHIKTLGDSRVRVLKKWLKTGRLLDIGCAYGPFLSAARDGGFNPEGLDISAQACSYVRDTLKIPARALSFMDMTAGEGPWDVLSLWYVIEHFENLAPVLSKLNSLLKIRGLLALGTPNFRGVTGVFKPEKFFTQNPWDHFSLWSPKVARRVLKGFGFQVLKIVPTGIHPERFPFVKRPGTLLWKLAQFLSKIFCWGDTFEIYARKVKEL